MFRGFPCLADAVRVALKQQEASQIVCGRRPANTPQPRTIRDVPMPTPYYAQTMARYNRWQNDSLVRATTGIGPEERERDRGAFFGSIAQTFHHVLWADRLWMSRFTGSEAPAGGIPESVRFNGDWTAFQSVRATTDRMMLDWAARLDPDWFAGDITWFSGAIGREITKPRGLLVMQIFNHQTHHRGQIHAMLTAAGARPDATDIPFMPDEYALP